MAKTRMRRLLSDATFKLKGGLQLPRHKPALLQSKKIRNLPVPSRLRVPLLDYQKNTLLPQVETGQSVRLGDTLASGIIAPADGCVSEIADRSIIHPSGLTCLCIELSVTDSNYSEQAVLEPINLLNIERLKQCGVIGLGGAGFSAAEKLHQHTIHTLIINAVECEPLISCDEALMIEQADTVVEAIGSMIEMINCQRCVLAIEADKQQAIDALMLSLSKKAPADRDRIELQTLAPLYPSGAERTLVKQITGIELSHTNRPVELGIACLNVATIYAAFKAQQGHALISRIITVSGTNAINHCNVRVRFGSSVADVLKQTGNLPNERTRVRAGGPLSGFDLSSLDVPITATTNCIALEPLTDKPQAQACIRCGYCSEVCPVALLPQMIYRHAHNDQHEAALRYGLNQCIECGCCDLVCPSSIELTQTFRYAKSNVDDYNRRQEQARLARNRHEKREHRLQAIAEAKEQQLEQAKKQLDTDPDVIAAALARARRRKRKR